MRERDFQQRITDYADWLGLTWHHETDSRRSKRGFPDLVIVGRGVVFAELKSDKGTLSPDQRRWQTAFASYPTTLTTGAAHHFVWRPEDWSEVQRVLRWLAD